mmetsp:Transcript_43905/g.93408  ORF Transcript_43905/g.93408 Transcript_43905/m.93408 type:complete len:132 (+) Transcript_43905:954-1349(+)
MDLAFNGCSPASHDAMENWMSCPQHICSPQPPTFSNTVTILHSILLHNARPLSRIFAAKFIPMHCTAPIYSQHPCLSYAPVIISNAAPFLYRATRVSSFPNQEIPTQLEPPTEAEWNPLATSQLKTRGMRH